MSRRREAPQGGDAMEENGGEAEESALEESMGSVSERSIPSCGGMEGVVREDGGRGGEDGSHQGGEGRREGDGGGANHPLYDR